MHKKNIKKKKGYFYLQVKGNQKIFKKDIEDYFNDKELRKKLRDEKKYNRKTEKQRARKYYYIGEID